MNAAPQPIRRTRTEQRAATRAALLDSAAGVFVRDGFQGASVEAIAGQAGYTRGAFYSNFESKEDIFAQLLQERVYSAYRELTEVALGAPERRPGARELGEQLAAIQAHPEGAWLFRLWLEVLAHAGRDEQFRGTAAAFWKLNRQLGAATIEAAYAAAGRKPPVAADRLASAMIALDIGLALQHFVDPQAAPLDLYPELFELLFGPVDPGA